MIWREKKIETSNVRLIYTTLYAISIIQVLLWNSMENTEFNSYENADEQ